MSELRARYDVLKHGPYTGVISTSTVLCVQCVKVLWATLLNSNSLPKAGILVVVVYLLVK
jgi:hypothetical protein